MLELPSFVAFKEFCICLTRLVLHFVKFLFLRIVLSNMTHYFDIPKRTLNFDKKCYIHVSLHFKIVGKNHFRSEISSLRKVSVLVFIEAKVTLYRM